MKLGDDIKWVNRKGYEFPKHDFGEVMEKKNLVTLPDGCDVFTCVNCGKDIHVGGLQRDRHMAGPCYVYDTAKAQKIVDEANAAKSGVIEGCWGLRKVESHCSHCNAVMVECPKKGHPNSKYWHLGEGGATILKVCPNNCPE